MRGAVVPPSRRLGTAWRRLGGVALLIGLLGLHGVVNAGSTDPARGDAVALAFDGASQTLLKASADALYRSADGGRHWAPMKLPAASGTRRIASVAVAAGGKGTIYLAGPGIGLLRSEDGGQSWLARHGGLPESPVEALATHADQPETVFAYVTGHGFFRSHDGGLHWQLMDAGPRGGIVRFVHSNMPGSMQTGWLFAATGQGVRRAMDCFCGWRDAGELGHPVTALAYDPRRPQNVYATTDEGLFLSANGGEQWSRVSAPAATVRALVVTPGGLVYAASADGTLFLSRDEAKTWERVGA